jgi:putative oxidoreductase
MMSSVMIAFAIRLLLVLLFSFSALDKVLNHRGAIAQASEAVSSRQAALVLILIGFIVEVAMSAGLVTGIADRAAAFILAGYCGVTALLWKQFWKPGDFWA